MSGYVFRSLALRLSRSIVNQRVSPYPVRVNVLVGWKNARSVESLLPMSIINWPDKRTHIKPVMREKIGFCLTTRHTFVAIRN